MVIHNNNKFYVQMVNLISIILYFTKNFHSLSTSCSKYFLSKRRLTTIAKLLTWPYTVQLYIPDFRLTILYSKKCFSGFSISSKFSAGPYPVQSPKSFTHMFSHTIKTSDAASGWRYPRGVRHISTISDDSNDDSKKAIIPLDIGLSTLWVEHNDQQNNEAQL